MQMCKAAWRGVVWRSVAWWGCVFGGVAWWGLRSALVPFAVRIQEAGRGRLVAVAAPLPPPLALALPSRYTTR